jgi:hypothetical protein
MKIIVIIIINISINQIHKSKLFINKMKENK